MTPSSTAAEPARPALRHPTSAPPKGSGRAALAALAVMLLAVVAGTWWARPPRAVPASAPATEFSAGRARAQLREITRAPHPVGTPEHARVRAYLAGELRRLGMEVREQNTTSVLPAAPGARAATVHNVLGRLRGTGSTGAVLLMAHYDAVPGSYGAADDGAGVTAILEALRALRAGPAPRNDVMVVFSDAEEVGLMGAAAFEAQDPWARDVGVVLNFEGRGRTGPVLMFQTSRGNGRLVSIAAGAVRHPAGSSLMVDVYRRLPNDTDLSVFLRAARDYPGLNFSFVGGHTHYHTPLDRFEELNPATLQHHGDYALALARAFGAADLRRLASPDHVYFDLPVVGLIHYPFGWALPVALLAVLAAAGVVVVAARKGLLTAGGVALGFGFFALSLALAVGIGVLGWKAVGAARPGLEWILQGDAYNADWWLLAFAGLVGAATLAVYAAFRRRASAASLAVGPLLAWAALALYTGVAMPGASYLFAWPVLLAAASLAVLAAAREVGVGRAVALALLAAPALMLFAPLVRMFETALGFPVLAVPMAMLALVLALLVPQLEVLARPRGRVPALALLALGVGALGVAAATSGFSAEARKPDSIAYLLDADSAKAYWASSDPGADEWTRQFLGVHPARRSLARYGGAGLGAAPLVADAPRVALAPPDARVLSDSVVPGGRRIRLRITSPRGAQRMAAVVEDSVAVGDVEVNGMRAPVRPGAEPNRWTAEPTQRILTYYAVPPEGIELAFTVRSAAPVRLRLTDTSYGLPAVPTVRPRPEWMMSKPFVLTDVTLLTRRVRI
jgi:hypothetical protein